MDTKKFQILDENLEETDLNSLVNKILMLYVLKKANEISPLLRGKIKFQKIFFLSEYMLELERMHALTFEYFRYDLGPFSKDLLNTFEDMESQGFTKGSSSGNYELTEEGKYLFEIIESSGLYKMNLDITKIIDKSINEYGIRDGIYLKNMAYKLEIPLLDKNTRSVICKEIRNIDKCTDLLPFNFLKYEKIFSVPEDLVEDLLYEFSLTQKDRDSLRRKSSKTLEELFAL